MEGGLSRAAHEGTRPRRGTAGSAELGAANAHQQNGEGIVQVSTRESLAGPGRPTLAAKTMERRNSAPQACYQRYMPMEVLKMPIPRKNKEKRALFQHVSTESREFEDIKTILTSSYLDANSSSCFTYSKPRLIDSEQLEKEFVEKRKEMKSDGRTEKELEENYCFLLATSQKLPWLCEKGLIVGHSRITILGNPTKGVYLSRYSDLIQMEPLMAGASGEIVIFKVLKGKVKSIYENMKNLMDPTPRFDSHISKNSSKVTSLNSYRAFELTQQYFYEYMFDELRQRPRQVCPYAVISFQFKGKDSILPSTNLPPVRLNSQSGEKDKGCSQFTVWTGDLVKGGKVLFQISLQSFSPPLLPHRLPEKLEIERVMKLDLLTTVLPSQLFTSKLYNSSQEVVHSGFYCSLLDVTDKSRSTTSVTKLLQELEVKRVVLVFPLSDSGFLLLLPSSQMAPPTERADIWKRCLKALFVFPESRDVAKHGSNCATAAAEPVMPQLSKFIPALHHSLVKVRANPPPELSAGVERQAREYFMGLKDGKVRHYSIGDYDSKLNEQGRFTHQRANVDGYLRAYLYNPAFYLLSVARAKQMVETHCPNEPLDGRRCSTSGGQRGSTHGIKDRPANNQEVQQLIDLVLTCKRNAENEVNKEEAGRAGAAAMPPGRKRRLEQVKAERAIKYLRASQDCGKNSHIPGNNAPTPPGSLTSVLSSLGLKDLHLREDGSEALTKLHRLLTGLKQAARGKASQTPGQAQAEAQREPSPFDGLAAKMGLPTNCDIDLRKQEDLEEQTAGSMSSLEGFSPGSHGGDMNHHGGAAGRVGAGSWSGTREGGYAEDEEDWPVPWVLIPITGLSSERYSCRELQAVPQDPRFHHLDDAAGGVAMDTTPSRTSPALSPEPNSPPSPSPCPSPYSLPSQCPSPEPSPPPSPTQCPSPEPSSPPSPPLCSSPLARPRTPPPQHPTSSCRHQSVEPNKPGLARSQCGVNEEHLYPTPPREFEERTDVLPNPADRKKEAVTTTLVGQEEHQPSPSGDEEQAAVKGPDSSLFSASSSSSAASTSSSHYIDAIVDKHQGNLSTEIQLILQRESIHLSLPQSPHSTSRGDGQSTPPPCKLVSQFSQYVSFYNPRPPVHEYVSSLQDGIDSLLTELHDCWLRQAHPRNLSDPSDTDKALASNVDAFVCGIREGREGEASRSPSAHTAGPWRPRPPDEGLPAPLCAVPSAPPSQPAQSAEPHPSDGFTGADRTACHPASTPPATELSSLISQIQPEIFSNLFEILQNVEKNSVQFYVHATEPGDSVYEEIKEHLLKQGNMPQSPIAFLRQENAESRLLVIIKNKDIAGHIHKIPDLVYLKRHPNVVFVGIDTLDDIMNNSYNELFVSGGCIISHEFIIDPDFITRDRLTALLVLLERLSSQGSAWRWKIHCKTHKRLKEQSRFRQDAAALLDILSVYQKRQIVEFLPYHYCDMTINQSPDLTCVMTLQAQCTQYRHIIVLTDRKFEEFPDYTSDGIVMASVEEVLHDLGSLVGYHSNKHHQAAADDRLRPNDQIHPNQPPEHHKHVPRPSEPGHSPLSSLPEQLIPDMLGPDGPLPPPVTPRELELLQMYISEFRAKRLAQQQQQPPQGSRPPDTSTEQPRLQPEKKAEQPRLHPEKKAVVTRLELIHSALQLETEEEDRVKQEPAEQRVTAASPSVPPSGRTNVTEESRSVESTADQRAETDCPVEGDRARSAELVQEQPQPDGGVGKPTGSSAALREQGPQSQPAPSQALLTQNSQRLAEHERRDRQSHLQLAAHRPRPSQQLAPPLPHGHALQPSAMFSPLGSLRGEGLLGARPVWSGGLTPAGAAAMVWGFQPGSVNFLGGYNNPGQSSGRHRRGQR